LWGETSVYRCEVSQAVPPRPSGEGRLETSQYFGKWLKTMISLIRYNNPARTAQ
jgi:hypothetical protein